jgi:hypothetical protein
MNVPSQQVAERIVCDTCRLPRPTLRRWWLTGTDYIWLCDSCYEEMMHAYGKAERP